MTSDNNLIVIPEEAVIVRRIFEMYIGGAGCAKIANTLNAEGIRNRLGNPWRQNTILQTIENEKYMGDSMMGKSVYIDGIKYDNMDGRYGKRYYMEDTHEGIVSKEVFRKAQEIRQQRKNPKLVGSKQPQYPFTGMIECGVCGSRFRHKVNNSGKAWQTEVWACATQLQKGVAECDCTRIKDSILREKFIEAYNEFVTVRPQGETETELRRVIDALYNEEAELAELQMSGLLTEGMFRAEQQKLKARISQLKTEINAITAKHVKECDYETISEFSEEKVKKFLTKVIVRKGIVTFVFYNGVEISRHYDNGPAGNQAGWKQKKEAATWR